MTEEQIHINFNASHLMPDEQIDETKEMDTLEQIVNENHLNNHSPQIQSNQVCNTTAGIFTVPH